MSTLAVYVDGVYWQEVPSFYGQATGARVFTVSRSPDQTVTTVTFGDGINGARLTSGTRNVVATYRYGSGAASPPAGRLTTILQPQPNLASDPEPRGRVGRRGPAGPCGRPGQRARPACSPSAGPISAADYEAIAASAPGVTRVAAWTCDARRGRPSTSTAARPPPRRRTPRWPPRTPRTAPVLVRAATPVELALSGTLVVAAGWQAAAVTAAAATALTDPAAGLFSPSRMGIGQRLYRSAVDAALMVPGVAAVHDLVISWAGGELGEFADPGEGSFFDLQPANITIGGTSASG